MKIILNDFEGATTFKSALRELSEGAETLSIAVSYVQLSGWEMFRNHTQGLNFSKMRIICSDQMNITHPVAIERAIQDSVQIRNYDGNVTYHPKVFIAHGRNGQPKRYLLGSANLSNSAFTDSVEAGILSSESNSLKELSRWFDKMFSSDCISFTPASIAEMKVKWRLAAALRARKNLRMRRNLEAVSGSGSIPILDSDIDTLEDILSTIRLPIGLLNMDHARNNIRTISFLRQVIGKYPDVSLKQKSELKLLGFLADGQPTPLAKAAAKANSDEAVASIWCRWLQKSSDEDLNSINPRLLAAKRAYTQFCLLNEDVQNYFLANAQKPKEKRIVQTIELLCNAEDVVHSLSLDDIRTLSNLLYSPRIPAYITKSVREYLVNKGPRGWESSDRRVLILAWKKVAAT